MTDQTHVAANGPSQGGALHSVGVARESPATPMAWPARGPGAGIEPSHPGEPDRVAGRLAGLPITKKIALHPPGAKRWPDRYGDALACVRYRVDAESGRRVVTVEQQVGGGPLKPRQGDNTVWVRVQRRETETEIAGQAVRRAVGLGRQRLGDHRFSGQDIAMDGQTCRTA